MTQRAAKHSTGDGAERTRRWQPRQRGWRRPWRQPLLWRDPLPPARLSPASCWCPAAPAQAFGKDLPDEQGCIASCPACYRVARVHMHVRGSCYVRLSYAWVHGQKAPSATYCVHIPFSLIDSGTVDSSDRVQPSKMNDESTGTNQQCVLMKHCSSCLRRRTSKLPTLACIVWTLCKLRSDRSGGGGGSCIGGGGEVRRGAAKRGGGGVPAGMLPLAKPRCAAAPPPWLQHLRRAPQHAAARPRPYGLNTLLWPHLPLALSPSPSAGASAGRYAAKR